MIKFRLPLTQLRILREWSLIILMWLSSVMVLSMIPYVWSRMYGLVPLMGW
jgi:hypothetical protein